MDVIPLAIPDIKLVKPRRFEDRRGFFSETFSRERFVAAGLPGDFVQDNVSVSAPRATVRGLHFQRPPFAQAKLIQVLRGSIFDVAVDIRAGSATFGKHVGTVLTAESWTQLFIPAGFAHGFCTLEPDTAVFYKVDRPYSAPHEDGILWNDPALAIPWPIDRADAILSDRDLKWPCLAQARPLDGECLQTAERGA